MQDVEEPLELQPEPVANPMAGWSFGLGLSSLILMFFTGIPAIILGVLGLQRSEKSKTGYELAVAGLTLGILSLIIPVFLLTFAMPRVKDAAERSTGTNNLRQMGTATLIYHDQNGFLPPPVHQQIRPRPGAAIRMDGRGLSWRYSLLPYMEQQKLFEAFDPMRSWDEGENAKWSRTVVRPYSDPDQLSENTPYQAFVGPNTAFDPKFSGLRFDNIRDGASNTILFAESAVVVPWASPRDMQYVKDGPLPPLGRRGQTTFLVCFVDSSVRSLRTGIDPRKMHALIQIDDGRIVDIDD